MKKQPANYSILKEFAFLSKDETHKLIAKKLEERYDVEIFDDFISVNNTSLFIKLRDEKVNLSEVVETTAKSKITGRKKVIFLCPQGYTVGASEAASRSDVTVKFWGEKETFDFLNAFGALVDRPKIKPNKKRKFFTFIQNALAKDKIKGYLVTAFLMLIMLRIYGLSIYYVAITVICIALATACVIKSRT